LEQVATFLLTDTTTPIELTAVNEATIGVIFEHVRQEIVCEIEDDESITRWRQLALSAYLADVPESEEPVSSGEDDWTPPSPTSCNWDQWDDVVESLADRILWDRDYELGELFMDVPPANSRLMKQSLGIEPDYFVAVAPDAEIQDGIEATYQRLAALARSSGEQNGERSGGEP
jgi:hypothetical protein